MAEDIVAAMTDMEDMVVVDMVDMVGMGAKEAREVGATATEVEDSVEVATRY